MAAPTFFGVATNPADNGSLQEPQTGASLTPPASMQEGDLVVVILYNENGSAGDGLALNNTGGQTWVSDTSNGSYSFTGGAAGHRIYWCRFNGTWSPASGPTFDLPSKSGTRGGGAQMLVFRPDVSSKVWNLDTGPNWAGFAAPTTPFTVTIGGVTPANPDTVTIARWLSDDDNTWGNLSGTGWSKASLAAQYRNTGGSDLSSTYAYNLKGASSATNNVSQDQTALGGDAGTSLLITFYASSGDVTANPSGSEAKASVGSVTVQGDANVSASGQQISAQSGTVTVTTEQNALAEVTGQQISARTNDVTVTGEAFVFPTGSEAPARSGVVTVQGDANVSVTGQEVPARVGTVQVTGDAIVTLTGEQIGARVGDVTVIAESPNVDVNVTGQQIAATTGTVSVTGDAIVSATGSETRAQVGDVTVIGDALVQVTGVEIAARSGNVEVSGDANVFVTGSEAPARSGTVNVLTSGDVSIEVTGQQISARVGDVTVIAESPNVTVEVTGIQIGASVGQVTIAADEDIVPVETPDAADGMFIVRPRRRRVEASALLKAWEVVDTHALVRVTKRPQRVVVAGQARGELCKARGLASARFKPHAAVARCAVEREIASSRCLIKVHDTALHNFMFMLEAA